MDADRAIAIIETVLAPKALTAVQVRIVRGVIAGNTYQQIIADAKDNARAANSRSNQESGKADGAVRLGGYQLSYIKETGAQLWQTLSQKLGQKVTKNSLAAVLLWYSKQPEFVLANRDRDLHLPAAPNPQAVESQRIAPDWGEGIQYPGANLEIDDSFYGRHEEIATFTDLCLYEHCRLILAIGMGGMGKTTLVWKIAHQLESYFDRTIWRSLLNAPPIAELCADLLQFLSPQLPIDLPNSLEGQIELLIACLKRDRCLLVLDNVESILAKQVLSGQYLPGYEGYDRIFRAIGELPHQSCAILTSREKPYTIARLEIVQPRLVRSMTIKGMTSADAYQLVRSYGCPQLPAQMWQEIHDHYAGNPLALKIATIVAVEMTGGGQKMLELYPLMKQGKLQFRNIEDSLDRQFERLSAVEQQLVYWLAIEREPVSGTVLRSNLPLDPHEPVAAIDALRALSRRCIITCQDRLWSMQPVLITYLTNRSIDRFVAELSPVANNLDLQHRFAHLNTYTIVKATAKDYLRQMQTQTILRPILDRSLASWGDLAALNRHLRQILAQWQTLDPIPCGYLAGNILNLLIELDPDRSLQDLDCSQLPIRSAYLANAQLHQVNFTAAKFDRTVFTQAFGAVFAAICHPAGELFATGDANGDVSLWQIADGQRIAIYRGHTNWTRALAVSADGNILASASEDRTVRLWDIQTGKQIALLGPHTHTFRGLKFSHDDRRLTIASDDGAIRIYDLPGLLADASNSTVEAHCLQLLNLHTNWVFSVAYNADESRLASASADGTVRIWDVATGSCVQILPHEHWVIRTLFSPDGRQLVVSGMSATIYVWDLLCGQIIQTLNGHLDWIWSIEMSADGKTLFSAGEDRTIRIWDLSAGICQTVFRAHHQRIWTIALTPDGRHLVSGSEDRAISVWDLQQGKCIKTIHGYGNWIKSIGFVPDREWLASCHRDGQIRIWDLQNFACIHTLVGHTDEILTIAISPDGHYLASSSLDLTMRIWDLATFTCLQEIDTQVEEICTLGFSPDGRKLISGNYRADLQIWDVATGKLDRLLLGHPSRIEAIAICRVRHLIATACEHKLRIWDLATGACLHEIVDLDLPLLSVAFSPDGRYLASGGMAKTVKIWDTRTWECWQTLTGHQGWTTTLAFSPAPVTAGSHTDYQLIVGSGDRSIKRWNIITGECLQTYTGHTNWIWSIVYSPDGARIASAGEDETIKIWDVEQSQALHTLQLQRPYEEMKIAGVTGLTSGQIQTLKLLGAIDEQGVGAQ